MVHLEIRWFCIQFAGGHVGMSQLCFHLFICRHLEGSVACVDLDCVS